MQTKLKVRNQIHSEIFKQIHQRVNSEIYYEVSVQVQDKIFNSGGEQRGWDNFIIQIKNQLRWKYKL
jgi:hypothetical protein